MTAPEPTYAGFVNQETFNLAVAIDTDDDLHDAVVDLLAAGLPEAELPEALESAVEAYINPIGRGYGRHALMDLIRTVTLIGSLWRVDFNGLAQHLLEGESE